MTHDPLCAWWMDQCGDYCNDNLSYNDPCEHMWCTCFLIAKVRADERGEDGKEDDRKAERDKVAREILDSETFMWLMAGSEREAYYLRELRRAYLAYCKDLDGGYGRWADRQRNKPWLNKEADRGES